MALQTENYRDEIKITLIPGNPPSLEITGSRIVTRGDGGEEVLTLPLEMNLALTCEAVKAYAVNLAKQAQSGSQIIQTQGVLRG